MNLMCQCLWRQLNIPTLYYTVGRSYQQSSVRCYNGEPCCLLSVVAVGASEGAQRWTDFSLPAANAPSRRCK